MLSKKRSKECASQACAEARSVRGRYIGHMTSPDPAHPSADPTAAPSALLPLFTASVPVFARYLNVSKNLVSDWERGKKRPGGPALRLLSIIQRKGLAAVA